MMLVALRLLAASTADTVTPNFFAIAVIVSPALIVYLLPDPVAVVGAVGVDGFGGVEVVLTAGLELVVLVSLSTCPGKIRDFQLRPLSASTEAVESPYRPAIPLTVSPERTL
jgi:hypothetical protein